MLQKVVERGTRKRVARAPQVDQLLGATDNFDRAVQFRKSKTEADGVQKIVDRYVGPVAEAVDEAFNELGAVKVGEVGVPFDPAIHEAAMTAPDDDVPADHVQKVFQCGFKVGDRLVRPATVVVSEGNEFA